MESEIGRDELKREAVAKFIIELAQKEPDLDAAIFVIGSSRHSAIRLTAGNLNTSRI